LVAAKIRWSVGRVAAFQAARKAKEVGGGIAAAGLTACPALTSAATAIVAVATRNRVAGWYCEIVGPGHHQISVLSPAAGGTGAGKRRHAAGARQSPADALSAAGHDGDAGTKVEDAGIRTSPNWSIDSTKSTISMERIQTFGPLLEVPALLGQPPRRTKDGHGR
jgi:hypothetical protein